MCVAEGTLILTPNGYVPVEELDVNSNVYSYDLISKALIPTRISQIRSGRKTCYRFDYGSSYLLATLEHPIYNPKSYRYETASKWVSGENSSFYLIEESDFSTVAITEISREPNEKVVFDITVDSDYSNFIANGVLVHNKSPLPLERSDPITDLAVAVVDSTSVKLKWTVPSDTTAFYIISFASFPFDSNTYSAANRYPNAIKPGLPNTEDSVTIIGLHPKRDYWFGIAARSRTREPSKTSNIVHATTL